MNKTIPPSSSILHNNYTTILFLFFCFTKAVLLHKKSKVKKYGPFFLTLPLQYSGHTSEFMDGVFVHELGLRSQLSMVTVLLYIGVCLQSDHKKVQSIHETTPKHNCLRFSFSMETAIYYHGCSNKSLFTSAEVILGT